jgi:hypothetical protein
MSYQDTSYNTYDKISSIDWNGQYFILTARSEIAGNAFDYAYSSDGISWSKNPISTINNAYSTKSLGDHFIVTGNLASSSLDLSRNCLIDIIDGQYPIPITTNLTGNVAIYDIERDLEHPNRIVFPKNATLALGNTISYSSNQGQSWTDVSNTPFSVSANDAVWNGKLWVAVGTGTANTIATSLDGVYWTGRGNTIFSNSGGGIDWSPQQKKYVAVGSGSSAVVATSMDGIYWKPVNNTLFSAGGNDVKWNGGLWVAVGNNGGAGNSIAYSYDAVAWQYAANSFSNVGTRIYYDPDAAIWTIYGSDPSYNIAVSSDGIHWQLSYVAGANALSLNMPRGLFADSSLNLYPGIPYPLYFATLSGINRVAHNHSDRGSAYIQPISIACGSGSNSLAYSIDGIQWTAIPNSIFTTRCNKAVWNGVLWAAVGAGSHWIATSYDGLLWTGENAAIMTECYDIAWNGTCFVAVGISASGASLAVSSDGIAWSAVTISSIFTTRIHAIEWTGAVWLAYGSGTNTTAISSNLDASVWTPTPTPHLCIVDCSNIAANNTAAVSASSYQGSNTPANAFDGSFNTATPTKWSSAGSNYDVSGNYIGSESAGGEWLQIQLTSPASCSNYYVVVSISDVSAIPKSWSLMGSNDASSWSVLDTFSYGGGVSPPNNDWKYPFVCLPLDISSGFVSSYSYFRIVFTSSFGASNVSILELVLFDAGAKQLGTSIRPIVLKDLILHPTRNLSISGNGGEVANIYCITDLSCNLIRSEMVHGGTYTNNIIYGLTSPPTASTFDGINHIVFSASGEVSYLSNTASNTHFNFDNSMNGMAIYGISGEIYAACYNRKFILAGSYYAVFNEYVNPRFYPNNLSSLFTSIKGLASNSGYGFVVSPNTIYLKNDERLSLVTPKFYDAAISSDTSISFNVRKSQP